MKAKLYDHKGCFEVFLEAETLEEAALITRMAMDSTSDLRGTYGNVSADGDFSGSIVIGARKSRTCSVPKAK